jgi:hypothetical protein
MTILVFEYRAIQLTASRGAARLGAAKEVDGMEISLDCRRGDGGSFGIVMLVREPADR